jgi:hypothetical protein
VRVYIYIYYNIIYIIYILYNMRMIVIACSCKLQVGPLLGGMPAELKASPTSAQHTWTVMLCVIGLVNLGKCDRIPMVNCTNKMCWEISHHVFFRSRFGGFLQILPSKSWS